VGFEGDAVPVRRQARHFGPVHEGPQLGEAPAQRRAGIVGTVPQQATQVGAAVGPPRGDEVGEERAGLP
jgi:hypothetical protein